MVAIINQPLGDVVDGQPRVGQHLPRVEDALMRDGSGSGSVSDGLETRKVLRMTVVRDWNDFDVPGYAALARRTGSRWCSWVTQFPWSWRTSTGSNRPRWR